MNRAGSKMKIGIPATSPDLNGKVENRLVTAAYLLVIDIDDLTFEAIRGPSPSAGPAAGIEAISLITRMGAKTILAGYISPHIELTLRKSGIEVITPVSGTVMDALEKYREGILSGMSGNSQSDVPTASHAIPPVMQTFKKTARQFFQHYSGVDWRCFAGGAFPWFHVSRLAADNF